MMHKSLRGELTTVHKKKIFGLENNKMVMAIAQVLKAHT